MRTAEERLEGRRVSQRKWREAHPEQHRESNRLSDHRCRARKSAYGREYKRRNRHKASVEFRRYYAQHKDRLNARRREWSRANPGKSAEYHHRRRARQHGTAGDGLSQVQWARLREEYGGRCAYCGVIAKVARDHIEPVSRGGSSLPDNYAPSCVQCNVSKRNHTLAVWLARGWTRRRLAEVA